MGTSAISEGFTCLFSTVIFYLSGVNVNIHMLVPMLVGALISVPFSAFIVHYTREQNLRIIVGTMTIFLGVYT